MFAPQRILALQITQHFDFPKTSRHLTRPFSLEEHFYNRQFILCICWSLVNVENVMIKYLQELQFNQQHYIYFEVHDCWCRVTKYSHIGSKKGLYLSQHAMHGRKKGKSSVTNMWTPPDSFLLWCDTLWLQFKRCLCKTATSHVSEEDGWVAVSPNQMMHLSHTPKADG